MSYLRSRLLLVTVVILVFTAVVPLALLSFFGLRDYQTRGQSDIDVATELLNERSQSILEGRAAGTAYALAAFLRERDSDLQSLAQLPRTAEAYLTFAQSRRSEIWSIAPGGEEIRLQHPLYRELAFLDSSGQEQIKIETVCFLYPWDCEIEIADNLLDVSDPANTLFHREDYFIQAQQLEEGEIYVGRPTGYYVSPDQSYKSGQSSTGERFEGIIRYITPIYEGDELQGYAVMALDHIHVMEFTAHLDPTSTILLPIVDPQPDNIAYIVGSDGAAIAHLLHHNIAGIDRTGQRVPFMTQETAGPGNFYEMGFLSPVFPELMDRVIVQPQGIVERYEVNGLGRSLGYSLIPYFTGPNYDGNHGFGMVIVSMDYEALHIGTEVLAAQLSTSLNELTAQFGSLILLAIFLVIMVTILVARGIVVPLRELTNYSQALEHRTITDDEITLLKSYKGLSEIAQLARTFGTMAQTVQYREAEIARLLDVTDKALNRRIEELSKLGEVGRRLTSTFDLDSILTFATQALLEGTHANTVQLNLTPGMMTGIEQEHIISATSQERSHHGVRAETIILLRLDRRKIGQFTVYTSDSPLEGIERVFAEQIADWVSTAIKNVQQFRYIEDQQRQLEETNREVMEANRLKAEFLATMSHELRTPLNAVIGYCGIMLEGMGGDVDDDAVYMLERIDLNAHRLLTLINDVLDFAKIEAGRLKLVSIEIAPHELAELWRNQMQVLASQKSLDFIVNIDPGLPQMIYGDPERLTQVVTNLLSNAFKFTDTGRVSLSLLHRETHWLIEVEDTGSGIPPESLNYIFEEFRQVDGSTTRAHGGSGLGLAIVRKLCHLMGGDVHCTSTLGKGSTFTVTLPIVLEPVV